MQVYVIQAAFGVNALADLAQSVTGLETGPLILLCLVVTLCFLMVHRIARVWVSASAAKRLTKSKNLVRTAFASDGYVLASILQEWRQGEFPELAYIAEQVGAPRLAALLNACIEEQEKIDDLPGETTEPGFMIWENRVQSIATEFLAAGGPARFDTAVDAYLNPGLLQRIRRGLLGG